MKDSFQCFVRKTMTLIREKYRNKKMKKMFENT